MAKKKAQSSEITLEQAIPKFLDYLREQGKNERTVLVYGRCLDNVKAFYKPEKQLGKITPALSGMFFKSDELLKKPNGKEKSEITVTQNKRVYRMMLVWAQEQGFITDVPLPKSEMKGGAKPDATESDAGEPAADDSQVN